MKNLFKNKAWISLLALLLTPTQLMASTPVEKIVPVTGVYTPRGYDTLDSSELVISGFLPNGCHQNPRISYTVQNRNINIKVTSLYYSSDNPFCPEVILPFVKTVDLGLLEKGDYNVVVNESSVYKKESIFSVAEATQDKRRDQVFANVQHIEKHPEEGYIKLVGHKPSQCFELDEMRLLDNHEGTISVMPIMRKIDQSCAFLVTPFSYKVFLPNVDREKPTLVHVRSMDGHSVNALIGENFEE